MGDTELPLVTYDGFKTLTLLNFLSNPLILHQTVPYLPISSLLALGAASKSFRDLVHHTPQVFRYLDLSQVKSVQFEIIPIDHGGEVWRNVQLDENVSEDDFYGGPLRGAFRALKRRHILQDVQTLILDGLSVTSELISEIILDNSFSVRLLSIREVKNLNERKLMQVLEYSIRPTRPAGAPRLKGLYVFGQKGIHNLSTRTPYIDRTSSLALNGGAPSSGGVTSTEGAQIGAQLNQMSREALSASLGGDLDDAYGRAGIIFPKVPMKGWADTVLACRGLISFDAILCTGPRHTLPFASKKEGSERSLWYAEQEAYLPAAIATVALQGCSTCRSAPEAIAAYGLAPRETLPLLAPPPLHSSTVKAATRPRMANNGAASRLLTRCRECLKNRYCESCQKWWCEDCYMVPVHNQGLNSPGTVLFLAWGARSEQGIGSNNPKIGAWRDCYECGFNCIECIIRTQHRCRLCGGGYCMIHNEGSTRTTAGRHAINGCRC